MTVLKVRRLYLDHKRPIGRRFIDRICVRTLDVLHRQGLKTLSGYNQRSISGEPFVTGSNGSLGVDADMANSHYNGSGPYLLFTPYGVPLTRKRKEYVGYSFDQLALISTDDVSGWFKFGVSTVLEEVGHAYFGLRDHRNPNGCIMGSIDTLHFCRPCLDRARKVEDKMKNG